MWTPVLQSIDNGTERFLVECELGLTTRFVRNVCDPVAEALSATKLSNATFGDIHAVKPAPNCIPDVVLLEVSNPRSPTRAGRLLSVGEPETFWTLPLEEYPVTSSLFERLNLEHHIGKCHCFGQGES